MKIPLEDIYRPIEDDLTRVSRTIKNELGANELISRLGGVDAYSSGKRVRSALSIFSAYALLDRSEKRRFENRLAQLAAGMELIHGAALVHDDVIDHSMTRRGRKSVNAGFGNEAAIAFGDYIYSKGIDMLASLDRPEIVRCVSKAAEGMCEGELSQILCRGDVGMKEHTYITIIKKKTALLMSSSCESSVLLVNKGRKAERAFSGFGLNFGIAFQIIDDCLDIVGSKRELGKRAGSDIRMGEMTLPLILALRSGVVTKKAAAIGITRKGDIPGAAIAELKGRLLESGAIAESRRIAGSYLKKANLCLDGVKKSVFKDGLTALCGYTAERLPPVT